MTSSDADESGGGAILPRPPPSKPNDERRAAHLMSEIQRRKNDKTRERTSAEELARSIVPKLASRAYHLDGYNVCQDWFQYMFNNHPLLGICCHHRFHPVTKRHRLIILLGSFSFGVAITNAIYLWFLGSGRDAEKQVFAVQLTTLGTAADATSLSVQSGVLTLLTVGSGSNALFDRFIWGMSACRCCRAGGRFEDRGCCRDVGYHVALLLVVATVALTSCIVVVRASMDEGQIAVPLVQNRTEAAVQDLLDFRGFVDEFDAADYSFLKGYALEFVVSLFVYYPILQTVFFSGILGCGSVPVLGGRPYSMKQEAKRQAKRQAEVQSVCPTEEDIA